MLPCELAPSDPPSFLEWYTYAAGTSLVPAQYHLWCGLAAVAACVADRVYYEKFKGERLTCNLYVGLIGPSGVGKNQAIRRAQKRVEALPDERLKLVQVYRGKISAEGILSRLGEKSKKFGNFVWLITPELAMQVGGGPKAESFITHMTELFDSDTKLQDYTRTSGHFVVDRPCANWTFGTTEEWMLRSVGKADILGGFFARIFPIPGERSELRIPKPLYPDDYDVINEWLSQYLAALTSVQGAMSLDTYADELHTWWIETRSEPVDEMLWHFYTHGDNLVLKLAMVLALADQYKLVIEYKHMAGAIDLYEWVLAQLPNVLEFAHFNPERERIDLLAAYFQRNGHDWLPHVDVLRFASNRGMARDVFKMTLDTLIERGDVKVGSVGTGRGYRWAQ